MHKTKTTSTSHKNKTKAPPSLTPKKSLTKNKDKTNPCSPRANRIHTLQAKASPQLPKKTRNSTQIESPLRLVGANTNKEKGWQTPKFKCELELEKGAKHQVHHNFFSFGEQEREKGNYIKGKEKDKENWPQQKQTYRLRRDQRIR